MSPLVLIKGELSNENYQNSFKKKSYSNKVGCDQMVPTRNFVLTQSHWTGLSPVNSYIIRLPEQQLRSQTLPDGENSCNDSHKSSVTTETVHAVFP